MKLESLICVIIRFFILNFVDYVDICYVEKRWIFKIESGFWGGRYYEEWFCVCEVGFFVE